MCGRRPTETTDDYVGYIEEILKVDYQNHCTTVLVCDWVLASRDAHTPNIVRDDYGFTLANFNHMDGKVHADSFAFPLHCQQVFFSDDIAQRGWKVVCQTEVRGRRAKPLVAENNFQVLQVGNDADFIGLQARVSEADAVRLPATTDGSYITATERRAYNTGCLKSSS